MIMKLVIASLLVIGACVCAYGGDCERGALMKCFKEYRETLERKSSYEEHCARVQVVINCFAKDPSCKGDKLDRFRLWILQEAALEKTLGCRDVAYESLNVALAGTKYEGETLVSSKANSNGEHICATEIHETCNKEFVKLMKKDKKICSDARKWFQCYSEQLTKKGKWHNKCDSDVINFYSDFVKGFGLQLVDDVKKIAGLC